MRRSAQVVFGLLLAAAAGAAVVAWLGLRAGPRTPLPAVADAARGALVARAGNCGGCHTARGGALFAGGRPVATPFGTVYSANLTPDAATGIGGWSAEDLRRALHDGRARGGRLLVPACPFDRFTRLDGADVAALHAYLRNVPAVVQPNRPDELGFPYGTQAALVAWRALFFRPARFAADPARTAPWNRGAYLVQGLGHCAACHAPRNRFGASIDPDALGGGLMAAQGWYAPPLRPPAGAGSAAALARLLQAGRNGHAALLGPMAEVVLHSTQYLPEADLEAIAVYLLDAPAAGQPEALPPQPAAPAARRSPATLLPAVAPAGRGAAAADSAAAARGRQIYRDHCADCHGSDGEGRDGAYVPLAGNPAVLRQPAANLVQVVLHGAFSASTRTNPRPFGMPPFAQTLDAQAVADVLTHVRSAWGNRAPPVSAVEVERWRASGMRP